jgi:hypothetical protein
MLTVVAPNALHFVAVVLKIASLQGMSSKWIKNNSRTAMITRCLPLLSSLLGKLLNLISLNTSIWVCAACSSHHRSGLLFGVLLCTHRVSEMLLVAYCSNTTVTVATVRLHNRMDSLHTDNQNTYTCALLPTHLRQSLPHLQPQRMQLNGLRPFHRQKKHQIRNVGLKYWERLVCMCGQGETATREACARVVRFVCLFVCLSVQSQNPKCTQRSTRGYEHRPGGKQIVIPRSTVREKLIRDRRNTSSNGLAKTNRYLPPGMAKKNRRALQDISSAVRYRKAGIFKEGPTLLLSNS